MVTTLLGATWCDGRGAVPSCELSSSVDSEATGLCVFYTFSLFPARPGPAAARCPSAARKARANDEWPSNSECHLSNGRPGPRLKSRADRKI